MRTVKGLMAAGLFSALLLTSVSAQAGNIIVTDDSGGGTLMTVTGDSGGAVVSGTSTSNNVTIQTFEVNGVNGLSLPTSYSITLNDGFLIGGIRFINSSTGTETIGTASGAEAVINFTVTGQAYTFTNPVTHLKYSFIDLTGTITSVTEDNYSGYSFAPMMVGAAISISIDKTGTDFTKVLGHNNMVVNNSGIGFQQDDGTVPEPSSMIMLGLGLGGMVAFRWRSRISAYVARG